MQYELFYLVSASKEAQLETIKKEVEKIVKEAEGEFLKKETFEKRRLSYMVEKESHGIYIAKRFELEKTENLKDITSKLNFDSNIARFIISKASELPELRSKEERISDLTRKEEIRKDKKEKSEITKVAKESKPDSVKATTGKEEVAKEEKVAKDDTTQEAPKPSEKETETEPAKKDDLDKKLEEILNI
jgi:ribosomal protein S6